jgi:hypothetical protein
MVYDEGTASAMAGKAKEFDNEADETPASLRRSEPNRNSAAQKYSILLVLKDLKEDTL